MQEFCDDVDIVVLDGPHESRGHVGHGDTVRTGARAGSGELFSDKTVPSCSEVTGRAVSRGSVHNICFHGIGAPARELEPGEDVYWISVDAFRRMLDVLAARPGVRISFDDGNSSDVEIALEALQERGLTATFFVVAGRLGAPGSLDEDDLRRLKHAGMTIGTHGMDHRPWRGLRGAELERELVDARARIADAVGHAVDEAALPLGAYDRRLLGALRQLGYSKVHTSDRRIAREGDWLQPRFSVVATDTPESLEHDVLSAPAGAAALWQRAKAGLKRLR